MDEALSDADIARAVLRSALSQVLLPSNTGVPVSTEAWGVEFGERWIRALHDGFRDAYPDQERFSVFSRTREASGLTKNWRRREYLYDVVVAEAASLKAPKAAKEIAVITRCLWQVESEVGLDATLVADDLGKLVLGAATSKLLIVAAPRAEENMNSWMDFIAKAGRYVPGNFFVAVIPTYSTIGTAHHAFLDGTASIQFYTGVGDSLVKDEGPITFVHSSVGEKKPV
jgi:hypothetical protein